MGKLVKIVDLDLRASPAAMAAQIFAELQSADTLVEVGYSAGIRRRLVAEPFVPAFGRETVQLDRDSVILMLGGARGIAA
ncbi:hypothetical protein, partial [Streptomyces europaeiscabiei]|uniref:hypothetical protein n=1 Tax=Streptomyces europaeiscabiei TaxID=146819 RepID=UPI0038F777EB